MSCECECHKLGPYRSAQPEKKAPVLIGPRMVGMSFKVPGWIKVCVSGIMETVTGLLGFALGIGCIIGAGWLVFKLGQFVIGLFVPTNDWPAPAIIFFTIFGGVVVAAIISMSHAIGTWAIGLWRKK